MLISWTHLWTVMVKIFFSFITSNLHKGLLKTLKNSPRPSCFYFKWWPLDISASFYRKMMWADNARDFLQVLKPRKG